MLEVTNKQRGPVQLVIRSRRGPSPNKLTVMNIPGRGSNKNVCTLPDELVVNEYIERLKKDGLISTRYIEAN